MRSAELIGELLGATDPNSTGNPAMAGDSRFLHRDRLMAGRPPNRAGQSYELRFPNSRRLLRGTYLDTP